MASLCATRVANLILGFPPRALIPTVNAVKLCSRTSPVYSRLGYKGTARMQTIRRSLTVSATNSKPTSQNSPSEEQSINKSSNAAEGPPLLTILAGVFVFFFVCWIIGSIVMWLISLILNAPPPK